MSAQADGRTNLGSRKGLEVESYEPGVRGQGRDKSWKMRQPGHRLTEMYAWKGFATQASSSWVSSKRQKLKGADKERPYFVDPSLHFLRQQDNWADSAGHTGHQAQLVHLEGKHVRERLLQVVLLTVPTPLIPWLLAGSYVSCVVASGSLAPASKQAIERNTSFPH